MGKIKKILENELMGGTQSTDVYPVTSTKAVYDTSNKVLDDYIQHLKKTSTFGGIATPTTNPGTPDGPVFYIASEPGTYANFNGISVSNGEAAILEWKDSWTKKTTGLATEQEIIYDVSARNGGAAFESLQALLSSSNLSTLIPTSVRHGGMSIRFIQGSVQNYDNKYVQWRYMGTDDATFTNIANWQSNADDISKLATVIEDKTSDITKEIIKTDDDSVSIEDNNGNEVFHIDENGLDAKDVKSNGKNVLTEQNLETLATKEEVEKAKVKEISEDVAEDADEAVIIETDDGKPVAEMHAELVYDDEECQSWNSYDYDDKGNGEQYAKVTSKGVSAKGFFDMNGRALFVPEKPKSIIARKSVLSSDESIELEENHIHSCKRIAFSADIDSAGVIEIGVGKNSYWSSWFEINSTNITLKNYTTVEVNPHISFEHGLTLKDNIQFLIDVDDKGNVDLRMTSGGNSFVGRITADSDNILHNWLGINGKIRVTSISSTLSNCVLSFTCDGYCKDTQVYGDSYVVVLSKARAYYYLSQSGYNKSVLLNAFPGQASISALADFKKNLKYSNPKYILWAMGMNDLDVNETTPSANWLNAVNEFLSICTKNGITPVLATIPSVVGGYSEDSGIGDLRIHKAKNDWVRASGYRYVDFAKAVGASDVSGQWYNNGLADDMLEGGSMRVHPTKHGAVALYHQMVTDFPEIMNK